MNLLVDPSFVVSCVFVPEAGHPFKGEAAMLSSAQVILMVFQSLGLETRRYHFRYRITQAQATQALLEAFRFALLSMFASTGRLLVFASNVGNEGME